MPAKPLGQSLHPTLVVFDRPDAPEQVALKDLIMVRNKLVEHRKSLKIMVHECSHPEGTDVLNDAIADLHTRIFELEKMIRAQLQTSRELRRRDRILQSIPGIGPITSAVLCASMPEKKHKVAIVTVMRKLVILADSLLRADRIWTPTPPVNPTKRYVELPQAVATGL